jgi:hypothetical protein
MSKERNSWRLTSYTSRNPSWGHSRHIHSRGCSYNLQHLKRGRGSQLQHWSTYRIIRLMFMIYISLSRKWQDCAFKWVTISSFQNFSKLTSMVIFHLVHAIKVCRSLRKVTMTLSSLLSPPRNKLLPGCSSSKPVSPSLWCSISPCRVRLCLCLFFSIGTGHAC